jgi:hypothetical protein
VNVNVIVIEVHRGRDSKLYPAVRLTAAERNRARWLAHRLVHTDGLSVRQAQAAMLDRGLRRSVGILCRDLQRFECPDCAGPPGG